MALYDKASLVLIPSGTKEGVLFSQKPTNGDGDFTFSRSTSATRVGSSGYIEKERTNYVRYSQDFSQWSILGGATITTGVTDPNGGSTAATISNIGAGSLSDGIAIFNNPMTIGAGSVVSQSIYLKGSGTIAIAMERGVSGTYFFYQKTITLTSTWQRFDNFQQIGSAADGFHFYVANYTGTTATSVDIAFAQFEFGTAPSQYIATTTSAVTTGITDNIPRLDYTDSSCPSLLLEPQRTNLLTYSEDFTSWTKLNGGTGILPVVTSNQTISPDGTQNADKIVFNKGAATSNSDYSLLRLDYGGVDIDGFASIYLKADSNVDIEISPDDVNYQTVSVTTEWQRFSVNDATSDRLSMGLRGTAPITTSATIYAWGAQLEAGSYATSYIPTYGSAVTRNKDVCNNAGNASTFNDSEGVLYAEVAHFANDSRICLNDGSTSNQIRIEYDESLNRIECVLYNGSNQAIIAHTLSEVGLFNKLAFKYKLNDFALWINGVEVGTDTSGTTFSAGTLSEIDFDAGNGTLNFYGKTNQILYFSTALTNEELATLTTI